MSRKEEGGMEGRHKLGERRGAGGKEGLWGPSDMGTGGRRLWECEQVVALILSTWHHG